MNNKSKFILLLLVIIEIIAETLIHKSINNINYLYIGILFYILVSILLYLFLKYYDGSFAIGNTIWQVSNILLISLISYFIFKEKLYYKDIIGLLFIIIGIIIIK